MSQSLKYICKCCGKEVKAADYEQIIANEKMCADCRSLEITGGKVEKKVFQPKKKVVCTGSLRREDGPKKKKKKPLSQAQKESMRMAAEAKWDRERYGMKSYVNYKDEDR